VLHCATCLITVCPAGSFGGTGQLRRGRAKMPRDDATCRTKLVVYLDCTSQLLSTLQPRSGRLLGQGLDLPQLRRSESRRRGRWLTKRTVVAVAIQQLEMRVSSHDPEVWFEVQGSPIVERQDAFGVRAGCSKCGGTCESNAESLGPKPLAKRQVYRCA
jgi:hypothetical protein